MKHEVLYLTEDRRVTLTSYRFERSQVLWNLKDPWEPARRPAVIVCPGGAYSFLTDREGEPVALSFMRQGFDAFVLHYSLNEYSAYPGPLEDISRAVWTVRSHADEWNIDPDQITVCGFSAGAHLCALLGTQWNTSGLCQRLQIPEGGNRPNAVVLSYPVTGEYIENLHRQFANAPAGSPNQIGAMLADPLAPEAVVTNYISPATAPTFLWQAREDYLNVLESVHFAERLYQFGVPFELHIFGNGPHGLSLGTEQVAYGAKLPVNVDHWFPMCVEWLKALYRF